MLFPNKLCAYNESILSKLPIILKIVKDGPVTVLELYNRVSNNMIGVNEFIEVLDCLFALQKIEYDTEKEVLKYVAGNSVQ